MGRKVLIVEDQDLNRSLLHKILEAEYEVLEASDGVGAIEILKQEADTVSAVLLDLIMPNMDGFQVLSVMRCDNRMNQIPVIIATGTEEEDAELKALSMGANDYVTKPYNADIIRHRVRNTISLRENAAMINAIRIDALTGLYARNTFLDECSRLLVAHEPGYFVMSSFDIDKFKVINDKYGTAKGDEVLKYIAEIFKKEFSNIKGICGRMNGDQFAVLYPAHYIDTPILKEIRKQMVNIPILPEPIAFSIGRYVVEDLMLYPSAMYDRALLAKKSVKGLACEHIAIFNETMRDNMLWEQEIVSEMSGALRKHQFEVWFQPLYNHASGAMVAAEALIRWRHPKHGLISPSVFIPVFERNGFIYELDKYVWKICCIMLDNMQKQGKRMVPISANVSRYDIYQDDLVDYLFKLVTAYHISPEYFRLEITETAFMESNERMIDVVTQLKNLGFIIAIDDFGSGYSSLNMLKDVPADILKLDMRFLFGKGDSDRGGNIVESVIRMAKWINMSVIAEGVEELQQADFLKSIGCYYVQGYLYAKPLPKKEFDALLEETNSIERMVAMEKVVTYDHEAFWSPKSMETLIFNSFVGGACIFEYYDEHLDLIRVNAKYSKVIFGEQLSDEEVLQVDLERYITHHGFEQIITSMKQAIDTDNEVTYEIKLNKVRKNGETAYIRVASRVIARAGDRFLFYALLEDITEEKNAEIIVKENARRMEFLNKTMNSLMNDAPGGFVRMHREADSHYKVTYINQGFADYMGLSTEQIQENLNKDMLWGIHPDDLEKVQNTLLCMTEINDRISMKYRIQNTAGKYTPFLVFCRITNDENGEIYLNIYYTDISKETREEERQKELMENIPCGAGIYSYSHGKITRLYMNKRYHDLVGRDDLEQNSVLESVQLEDRAYLLKVIQEGILHNGRLDCDVHILHGSGKYLPFHLNGNVIRQNASNMMMYVTYMPISENEISFREMIPVALETVMASSSDLSFVKDRTLTYVCASRAFANMVGYSDEKDLIGKTDYDLFEKGMAEKYRQDDQNLITHKKSLIDYVEQIPSNDGMMHYSSTSKYLLKDGNGNIVGLYGVGRDITETRDAYQKLKLLTDSIPGGIATYEVSDGDIRVIYSSDGVYALVGYQDDRKKSRDTDPLRFIVEEDMPLLNNQISTLTEVGNVLDCVFRVIHCSGEYRYINLKGSVSERSDNKMIINAALFDVTAAQLADMKLKAMERENWRRYEHELQLRRELIRNSIFYYQISLTSGIIEEYHSLYADVDGMHNQARTNEALRENILENVYPDDRENVGNTIFSEKLLQLYYQGNTSISIVYRRKILNKGYHWVKTKVSIMEKPESDDIVAFLHCTDIDADRKKQMAIESILNDDIESVMILNVSSGQACIAHMRDNLADFNEYAAFDFDKEYNSKISFLIEKEDQDKFVKFFKLEAIKKALKRKKMENLTFRVRKGNVVRRKTSSVFYLDDMQDEIILVRRDTTDLYEEEQRQKKELQKAMEEATRANHAKSDFLSQMSHDIRTPLNAVLAFSNKEMIDGADEQQLKKYLEKVNLSGDYLLGIINDVLDMSKIEQKKIVLNPEAYSLVDFVETIKNVISELSKNRDITFNMITDNAVQTAIQVDRVRFNQIFINLLSNAVKFTPKGGTVDFIIKQEIGEDAKLIRQQFIVRDTGIGMSKEFLPHAFESFNQEYHKETSERSQGTGLGLAIVKELVSMMHGSIDVESELGKGTTFTVELPLEIVQVQSKEQQEEENDFASLKDAKVLLCEDNEINTEIATILLKKKGCQIYSAKNGQEAVEAFQKSETGYFDLILMDIRMPVMNGLVATDKIRKLKKKDAKKVPIIAMTADAFSEDEKTAYEAGMNDHLSKPFDPNAFYRICNSYIEKYRTNRL